MEDFKKQLAHHWFMLVGIIAIILDTGFDVINPILADLNLGNTAMTWIKVIFGIYSVVKLHKTKPLENK